MRFPFPPAEPTAATGQQSSDAPSQEGGIAISESSTTEAVAVDVGADPGQLETPPEPHEPSAHEVTQECPAIAAETSAETQEHPHTEIVLPAAAPPRARPKRKVIAFPRQPIGSETLNRLADPVLPEQPRILDVPEELEAYPTTAFLEGLRFESTQQTASVSAEHVELPCRAASIWQRICAAMLDCALVAMAAAAFAFIGHKMLPTLIFDKTVRLIAALVLALLWAIYQYLLLIYGDRTVGMHVTGISLSTFQGQRPSLRHRRNRVLGFYLSTASLIMGLMWALVDVDALCWHDRISGTYLIESD